MGVKVRKLRGKWYLVIDYRGKRKTRVIGTDRKIAEQVRRQVEAKLALGDVGILEQDKANVPTFATYAERWLESYAVVECKRSSVRSYEQLLRLYVTPRFGQDRLSEIKREDIRGFLGELSRQAKPTGETTVPRFARNTLRLIVSALRTVLSAAVEDGIIASNPAARLGRFAKAGRPAHRATAMTRTEAEAFLTAVLDVCPEWFPFFLTALRAGLRKGELIALKWGDIQFGGSELDRNRFILVQRNYSLGAFTTPKNKKSRRVDLSRQLRAVLLDLRDKRLLQAFLDGKTSISDELVFPSKAGTPIKPDNIAKRYMTPALEKAGLRHFRFHDLRHTFGSLLIQDGASLTYVKEQMGHGSIQITADTYGHLIPGADIAWVDRLDAPMAAQKSANRTQTPIAEHAEREMEVIEKTWLPPRDSNPDMLIQSQPTAPVW
jgi:integrase